MKPLTSEQIEALRRENQQMREAIQFASDTLMQAADSLRGSPVLLIIQAAQRKLMRFLPEADGPEAEEEAEEKELKPA